MVVRIGEVESSLGTLIVAWTERGVAAIAPAADPDPMLRALRRRFPRAEPDRADATPLPASWEADASSVPVDLWGLSAFDALVYRAVREIPAGQRRTYGEVAALIGSPGAARAVGGAMARCPLFPLVPCHRVVRATDGWSGWSGDPALKRRLLRSEGGGGMASGSRSPMRRPSGAPARGRAHDHR